MSYKPLSLRIYLRYIKIAHWTLRKGGIDHNLYDENGLFLCAVKVTHGKNTKGNEVAAHHVRETEKLFQQRGLAWPPSQKKK